MPVIGSLLSGRYRVESLLGEGSMGQVYLVDHVHLNRREALKVLHPNLASSQQFSARFRREARATNRVQHPNVVSVYDFGQLDDGRMYLAMEYANGESLSARLARVGALSPRVSVGILTQLADALDYAHSRAVVHRDLKPANLILTEHRGQPDVLKVLDFGMAKIVDFDSEEARALTGPRDRFGTPLYMAPEQFESREVNPRSDIYAIGCIAFEMLTGRPVFPDTSLVELMNAHRFTVPPRVLDYASEVDVPAVLDAIVAACLAKDPADRFATGRALCEALRGSIQPHLTAAARHSRRSAMLASVDGTDFDDVESTVQSGGFLSETTTRGDAFPASLAVADTAHLDAAALRADFNGALVELAEALIDAGARDAALDLAFARVLGLQDDLARVVAELTSIDREQTAVERSAREREARLRFAVGELRFSREQASDQLRADLDFQIQELEGRVTNAVRDAEEELDRLTKRAVGLAATRWELETLLDTAMEDLDERADELARAFEDDSGLAPCVDRYRAAREAVSPGPATDPGPAH